jgi:hypothetical protein
MISQIGEIMRVLWVLFLLTVFFSCGYDRGFVKLQPVSYSRLVEWDEWRKPPQNMKVLMKYDVSLNGRTYSGKVVFVSSDSKSFLKVYGSLNQLILSVLYSEDGILVRGSPEVYRMFESFDDITLKELLVGYLDIPSWEFKGLSDSKATFSKGDRTLTVLYPHRAVVKEENMTIVFYYGSRRMREAIVSQDCCSVKLKLLKMEER